MTEAVHLGAVEVALARRMNSLRTRALRWTAIGERSGRGRELGERGELELGAARRGALEQRALVGPEPVEAGSEQGVDRRRHRALGLLPAQLGQVRAELLEEERVSFRRVSSAWARTPSASGSSARSHSAS